MDAFGWQRLSHRLYKKGVPKIPGLIQRYIHFRYNSDLNKALVAGEGTRLGHGGIGVVVNKLCKLGRNCILAQNVTLASKDGGAPVLGDWVYVGANSVVLGGVKIGNNAFVGALSLVNKDVPDNAIVIGIPAKVLKIRTKEEVDDWHRWVMQNGGAKIDELEGAK